LYYELYEYDKKDSIINKQIKEADKINRQPPLHLYNTLQYTTHSQAVYISRPLDYKNFPEPKNDDNSLGN